MCSRAAVLMLVEVFNNFDVSFYGFDHRASHEKQIARSAMGTYFGRRRHGQN
jgi:hypothetical protein